MAKKPEKKATKDAEKPPRKRASRDYSQRAHDLVREVQKRHEERPKGE